MAQRILLALAALVLAAPAAPAATLVVEAGDPARQNVPVCADLPEKADKARLADEVGKEIPCQVADGKLWFILDSLPAGGKKSYTVELGKDSSAQALGAPCGGGVTMKESGTGLDIAVDGKEFTRYEYGTVAYSEVKDVKGKDGKVSKETKSGKTLRPYFYPLYGAGGVQILRPYPMAKEIPATSSKDHPHHTGIWVAYGEVNGVDNWSTGARAGFQIHKSFETLVSGPVVGLFRESLDWTDVDKKPNLAELRTVRIYRLPQDGRLMDIEVTFQAKYGQVHFGDTKEAGIPATRMRDEMRADKMGKGRLLNSEGIAGKDTWAKRAKWVDCSGPLDGQEVGYAIFDHPGNHNHPAYWHSRDYGLVTVNPFSEAAFVKGKPKTGCELAEGKEITLRYRLYFHTGDAAAGKVPDKYADFAQPPKTTWK